MSRNRMRNSQSLHWMGVVKWVLIAGLLSLLGLSYMLCKNQNLHLAQETYRLQIQLEGVQKRNAQLTDDLYIMKSPLRLQRRLAQMHSSLVRLSDGGVVVVQMDTQEIRARLAQLGTLPTGGLNLNVAATASTQPAR
jgi:hypothetical protein